MSAPVDERYMRRALALGARVARHTRPNPAVGAVVVRAGAVVGEGATAPPGGDHAEVAALKQAGARARGATVYVTLEPCCHTGRTGPCTEALLAAGVTRVVVGCRDRNPLVAGRGIRRLQRAGVQVDVGCLGDACEAAHRAFFTWIAQGRPLVTLKVASSLDGYIAPPPRARRAGEVWWLTGTEARHHAHELRARQHAILVGVGTILADDPELTVRLGVKPRRLLRVVLDSRLRTPPDARILRAPSLDKPLLIALAPKGNAFHVHPGDPDSHRRVAALPRPLAARARRLLEAGAEMAFVPGAPAQPRRPDLAQVLAHLAVREVQSLLVEGGATVHRAFTEAHLVDQLALFFAPVVLGAGVRSFASGRGATQPPPLARFAGLRATRVGADIVVRADAPHVMTASAPARGTRARRSPPPSLP